MVPKELFISLMSNKWASYNLAPNPALKEAWGILANTLNRHMNGEPKEKWSVLAIPTGAGKTQGLITYCAELSRSNSETGIVIITKFITEANSIAAKINEEADKLVALAAHSENILSPETKQAAKFLVITHSAYTIMLRTECPDNHKFNGMNRITVIDEALDVMDSKKIDLDEVRIARAALPFYFNDRLKMQIKYLDHLIDRALSFGSDEVVKWLDASDWRKVVKGMHYNIETDLEPVFAELKSLARISTNLTDEEDKQFITSARKRSLVILKDFMEVVSRQAIYYKSGLFNYLQSAEAILPAKINNTIVLDATARQNLIYKMFDQFIEIPEMPKGIRNYGNMTLNIHYGVPVGKSSLAKKKPSEIKTLLDKTIHLEKSSDALFCVHKDLLEKLNSYQGKLPNTVATNWGNIDGKNEWKDKSTVILFGLPYLGDIIAESKVMAVVAWHEHTGNYYNSNAEYHDEQGIMIVAEPPDDYHKDFERSHIIVSIIQALNRIRCRVPIDNQGNCESCNAHLFLKTRNGVLENEILDAISTEMQDIKIKEHDIDSSLKTQKLTRQQIKIIEFFNDIPFGEHTLEHVKEELILKGVPWSTFQTNLTLFNNEPSCLFSRELKKIGIEYRGVRGRKAKTKKKDSVFIKSHNPD